MVCTSEECNLPITNLGRKLSPTQWRHFPLDLHTTQLGRGGGVVVFSKFFPAPWSRLASATAKHAKLIMVIMVMKCRRCTDAPRPTGVMLRVQFRVIAAVRTTLTIFNVTQWGGGRGGCGLEAKQKKKVSNGGLILLPRRILLPTLPRGSEQLHTR